MSKSNTDKIYAEKVKQIGDFRFDDSVADVFSDMIHRSVPGYDTITEASAHIANHFVKAHTNVIDIGCSLGATSMTISRALPKDYCEIHAIDNAPAMVERCKRMVAQYVLPNPVHVKCADALEMNIDNASLICMNFTLQFIAPEQRLGLLNKLCEGLVPGGALLISEKIRHIDTDANNLLIELHHSFKRQNGYSELEIAQKRAALENVMLTDTIDIHEKRLKEAGFDHVVVWLQNYNFVSMLAVKK